MKKDRILAIEEMAAAIAHEVKNPLTLVKANIDLLEASDSAAAHQKNYGMIRKELDKINDIMMDFIHLTRQEQAEQDIVYPNDILCEIIQSLQVANGDKINISLNCADADLAVLANEKSLKILFDNIFKNALEAMNFQGFIDIDTHRLNQWVKIKIHDSGPGFAPELADTLFTDFFTTKTAGSGLGLSICKKITAELGGGFTLKNAPCGGCIATVRLPVFEG